MTLPSGIGHSVTQRRPASTAVMVNEPPRLPRCLAQPCVPGSNAPSSCAISLLTSHSGQRATSVHAFQTASGSASNVASHSNKYMSVLPRIVLGLFGDDQFANVFLVGAGFQAGALPLPPDAIEEAIRVNGVAVEKNLQAFRRGRQYVADPVALLAAAALDRPAAPEEGESPL